MKFRNGHSRSRVAASDSAKHAQTVDVSAREMSPSAHTEHDGNQSVVKTRVGKTPGMNRHSLDRKLPLQRCAIVAVFAFAHCLGVSAHAQTSVVEAPTTPMSTEDALNAYVDQVVSLTGRRFLDANGHTPWQVLHGLLALRENYELKSNGQKINALEWISTDAKFRGVPWVEKTADGGRIHPFNGEPYEFEGHVNQSLAIISMCNLPLNHEFKTVSGQIVTMQDMVNHAKLNTSSLEEITWTLWFLTRYVDQDEEWINNAGEPWSMERLVRMQVTDSPYDSPCGGCHGMFALAYARNAYLKQHGQLRGAWLEADQKLQRYIATARRMQNSDGSFSSNFFKSTGYTTDTADRLNHSGHMLEWLVVALPKRELQEQWVQVGVRALCDDVMRSTKVPVDGKKVGGLYHAVHALVLYREQTTTSQALPELADAKPEDEVEGQISISAPSRPAPAPGEPAVLAELPEIGTIVKDPRPLPTTNNVPMPIRVSEGNDYNSREQRRSTRRPFRIFR